MSGLSEEFNPESIREVIQEYKKSNFYLEDLSCCENECIC